MLPLLGILAAGAMGQDWYHGRRQRDAAAKVSSLLGEAPGTLAGDGMGPPSPGTGLMANPGDERAQLEFARGVMSLAPRERAAAHSLFEGIMGRASSQRSLQEGRQFTAQQSAIGEANVNRRWESDNLGIEARFNQQQDFAREQFNQNKLQYGERQAWEKYTFEVAQAQAAADELRKQAQERRAQGLYDMERVKFGERGSGGAAGATGGKLPVGYRPVAVMGANGVEIVGAPIPGTKEWTEGQETVDQLSIARDNVKKLSESLKKFGTEHVGAGAGEQKALHGRVIESMGLLAKLGVLNVGDVERIQAELPDPTEVFRMPLSNARIQAQLTALDKQFETREDAIKQRSRGWGLTFKDRPKAAPADRGRAAPPAGSERIGG